MMAVTLTLIQEANYLELVLLLDRLIQERELLKDVLITSSTQVIVWD